MDPRSPFHNLSSTITNVRNQSLLRRKGFGSHGTIVTKTTTLPGTSPYRVPSQNAKSRECGIGRYFRVSNPRVRGEGPTCNSLVILHQQSKIPFIQPPLHDTPRHTPSSIRINTNTRGASLETLTERPAQLPSPLFQSRGYRCPQTSTQETSEKLLDRISENHQIKHDNDCMQRAQGSSSYDNMHALRIRQVVRTREGDPSQPNSGYFSPPLPVPMPLHRQWLFPHVRSETKPLPD